MKLIRFGEVGKEKCGVQREGVNYDVSDFVSDYNESFFENEGLKRLQDYLETNTERLTELPRDSRLGAPFSRPSKIVCIGLNYKDHAEETGAAIPAEPIIF